MEDLILIDGETYKIDSKRITRLKDHVKTPIVVFEQKVVNFTKEENPTVEFKSEAVVRVFDHIDLESEEDDDILILENGTECYYGECYVILATTNTSGMVYYDYLDDYLFHKEVEDLPKLEI